MHDFQIPISKAGIFLNSIQVEKLKKYIDLILEWNKRTNLISRKDESKIVENHVLESLAFLLSFEIFPGAKIIDIGSGAGFPSLPISLIKKDVNFLLVESKRLKVLFLKEVISQLEIKNAAVLCDRAEHLSKNMEYDFAFSRGVAKLEVVYDWVEKILKPNGYYIAWKGGKIKKELTQLLELKKNIFIDVFQMDERLVPTEKNRLFVRVRRMELNNRGEF